MSSMNSTSTLPGLASSVSTPNSMHMSLCALGSSSDFSVWLSHRQRLGLHRRIQALRHLPLSRQPCRSTKRQGANP